jgi:hypothetical protein
MRNRKLSQCFLLLTACLLLFGGEAVWAQKDDDSKTRSITSDDFAKQRPAASGKQNNKTSAKQKTPPKPKIRRAQYKFVKQEKSVVRRKPTKKPKDTSLSQLTKTAEVGVTMWRMRKPVRTELGPKLPVQMADGSLQMWIPERVGAETIFQKGDRVRLAIESSVVGYLYVIDSEIYSDGRFGPPALIFPDPADEDNYVQPGLLVDIPDQRDDLPYFLIDPKGANYTGELLTVIISPKPLVNLKIDDEGYIKNLDELSDLEENSEVKLFSRNDEQDKTYTKEEANAACGATTRRELIREKSPEKPCGDQTRQLTREEPLPQSIYQVKTVAGQAVVAFVRLQVGR